MDTRETSGSARMQKLASKPLSLISIGLDSGSAGQLKRLAESTSLIELRTELHNYLAEDTDFVFEWIRDQAPDIYLIDFDTDRRSAVFTAEKIHETLRSTAIFAISSNSQPDLIIQAMRCGCSEYLLKPITRDQLLEAVARVGGRKREEQFKGQVLTFIGAKGGSGVTTLVTHLGAFLAKSCARKTLLIDLHPHVGDATLYLGLTKHQYHLYELVESFERLDSELLQSFLVKHPSGLDLLAAPETIEPLRRLAPEALTHTINFLRLRYEFLLVDSPPGVSEQHLEVIRCSDQVYLVGVPEVSALRNMARYLEYMTRIEYPQKNVRVVLNRHEKRGSIPDGQIEKAIRRSIYWKVPNHYNEVVRTINGGDPVSQLSTSEVARSLMAWAESLGKRQNNDQKKPTKGAFGLWGLI